MKVRDLRIIILLLILFICLSLSACSQPAEPLPGTTRAQLEGAILLWHDWVGAESLLLNRLLDRFEQLHPEVTIISIAIPPDELVPTFTERVKAGLGPDLLLIDARLVYQLAQAGLLVELSQQPGIDPSLYLNAALSPLRTGERLYGLPFAVHTRVLYYNSDLVAAPPATLDEWVAQADSEQTVAFNTNLASAFWGVRAFGGRMFNEEGQWVLDKGGFVNWIDFLTTLQATPGFILDNDAVRLRLLFESGEAAYYIGSSSELLQLQTALGAEKLGMAALPSGPGNKPAGPILQTDAFAFSRVASREEMKLALDLAQFMTNLQQQTRLAVEPTGRLPVHTQVRFRQTLSPLVVELAQQSRTALPIDFEHRPVWDALAGSQTEINDLYMQALAGIAPSNQVVQQITSNISQAFEMEPEAPSSDRFCPSSEDGDEREVSLWHSLEDGEAAALIRIARNFEELCPGISVQLTFYDFAEIQAQYRRAVLSGGGPDMLLGTTRIMSQLAEEGFLRDLSEFVDASYLQQFLPEAEAAMRYNGRLHGLPESVAVQALYYNTDLAADPILNLNEAPIRVTSERQFALPATFFFAYWGFAPFGGFEFNSQTGAISEDEGLVNWLSWLQEAQGQRGMRITTDFVEAETLFAQGEAAYFVSGPGSLPRIRRELGEEKFRVAPLPAGPEGPASPLLQVQGVMVSSNSDESTSATAVAFGKYLATAESQRIFLNTDTHVSALVSVDLSDRPHLTSFREQAKVSTVVAETPRFAVLEELGNELFEEVLVDGQDPTQAVEAFEEALDAALNLEVTEE